MIGSIVLTDILNIGLHCFAHSRAAAVVIVDQHGKFQETVFAGIKVSAQRDHAVQGSCFGENKFAVVEIIMPEGAGLSARGQYLFHPVHAEFIFEFAEQGYKIPGTE